MLCALVGSAVWVNNATRLGMAVSTSHSIGTRRLLSPATLWSAFAR
jgi:hypothetical protein